MISGRFLPRFVLTAAVALAGHTAAAPPQPASVVPARMPSGPAADADPCEPAPCPPPCPPVCVRPTRIKVIVPPPEIVFRQAGAKAPCGGPAEKPPPAAAPQSAPQAATTSGTVTLTHTVTVPYVTYHWVPAALPSGTFAGAGLPPALPGLPVGLGNLNLAANLGLVPPAAPEDATLQLLRTLLNRSPADRGKDGPSAAPTMPPADSDCEALLQQINALNRKIDAEITKLRDQMTATDKELAARLAATVDETNRLRDELKALDPAEVRKRVDDLQKRLTAIEENKKIKELLGK